MLCRRQSVFLALRRKDLDRCEERRRMPFTHAHTASNRHLDKSPRLCFHPVEVDRSDRKTSMVSCNCLLIIATLLGVVVCCGRTFSPLCFVSINTRNLGGLKEKRKELRADELNWRPLKRNERDRRFIRSQN